MPKRSKAESWPFGNGSAHSGSRSVLRGVAVVAAEDPKTDADLFAVLDRQQLAGGRIYLDKVDKIKGMNITFVTTATTDEEGRALLVPGRLALEFF